MAGAGHQPFLLEREEEVFTSEASFGALDRELGMRIHVLRRRPLRRTTRLCQSIAERFAADVRNSTLIGEACESPSSRS